MVKDARKKNGFNSNRFELRAAFILAQWPNELACGLHVLRLIQLDNLKN